MKKVFLTIILGLLSIYIVIPVNTYAISYDSLILISDKNSNNDLNDLVDDYNQEQTCQGEDSVLGDPDDENSVAWLLDQILSYATLVGMLLVIVLSSIDFLTVIVKSDENALLKAAKKFGFRLLFAILLFFVPTLTNVLLDIFGLTSQSTCGIQQ